MESQAFVPAAYSLRPIDLIPPDDFEDEDDVDVRWLEYCRMAASVRRDEVLAVVLDELNSPTSPLFDLIDDALATPHPEPDRPRTNVTDLIKLGQAILGLVAKAVEDAVGLRMAVQVHHGNRAELHDQLVSFVQNEHRGGFLLADPLTICTIDFWEHFAAFIAAQDCERCHQLETRIAHLNREIANCQRWLRWLLRYRGGRRS